MAAAGVENKGALGGAADEDLAADGDQVQVRRQLAVGNQFQVKFQIVIVGRRGDGVRALDHLLTHGHAERGVLSGVKGDFGFRAEPDYPELCAKFAARGNGAFNVFGVLD